MVEHDSLHGVADGGVGDVVVARGFGEFHAAPLARHDFVGDFGGYIAGEGDGFLGGALDAQGAVDHESGVVVEEYLHSGGHRERGAFLDHYGVVDLNGFEVAQAGVGGDAGVAAEVLHIAAGGLDGEARGDAVGEEFDVGDYVDGHVAAVFGECGLDEDVDGVVFADFDVGEFFAADAVDVEAEGAGRVVGEGYAADYDAFVVAVVDEKLMGRRGAEGEEGAEAHGVGRERGLIGGGGADFVVDARRKRRHGHHGDEKSGQAHRGDAPEYRGKERIWRHIE